MARPIENNTMNPNNETQEITVEGLNSNSGTFSESFEKYKLKIDLFKWVLGTFGLTLITYIINWGFKDREQGMEEISQYERYLENIHP